MKAIKILIILCNLQKNRRSYFQIRFIFKIKFNRNKKSTTINHKLNFSKFIIIECKFIQFIFCFDLKGFSIDQRLKSFHSIDDLKRHFQRKHLRDHFKNQSIECFHFKCKIFLQNIMHLQNHAELMH